jgi:hypothetical protein
MWRFIQRINHRNATLGHLDALLMMYPRKRQFFRDFPNLRQTVREHFEGDIMPASSALAVATSIIESFLHQLSSEEKSATAAALAASDLREIERLAERRISGERDRHGDKASFATQLSGVAMLMAGKMAGVNALQREEYAYLVAAIERALGAETEHSIAETFAHVAGGALRLK